MLGVIGRKMDHGERDEAAIERHGGGREEDTHEGIGIQTRKKGVS